RTPIQSCTGPISIAVGSWPGSNRCDAAVASRADGVCITPPWWPLAVGREKLGKDRDRRVIELAGTGDAAEPAARHAGACSFGLRQCRRALQARCGSELRAQRRALACAAAHGTITSSPPW